MAIGLLDPHLQNHACKGLREIVIRLDAVVGNSTWRSTATDATTLKQLMVNQSLLCHECDRSGFQIAIRRVDELVRIGILDNADIAAMNDLATSRQVFADEDSTIGIFPR
jgi:hypothetical protein